MLTVVGIRVRASFRGARGAQRLPALAFHSASVLAPEWVQGRGGARAPAAVCELPAPLASLPSSAAPAPLPPCAGSRAASPLLSLGRSAWRWNEAGLRLCRRAGRVPVSSAGQVRKGLFIMAAEEDWDEPLAPRTAGFYLGYAGHVFNAAGVEGSPRPPGSWVGHEEGSKNQNAPVFSKLRCRPSPVC